MTIDADKITGIQVNSKVDSVIVYTDRVCVTRIAEASVDKDTNIIFTDLPGAIDDQSVRVKAKDLTIGELQIRTGYALQPIPRVKELQDKIKALEIDDRNLNDELTVLSDKEKFLLSLAASSSNIILKEINTAKVAPDAWQQGVKFMVDELVKTKKRRVEIEIQRQKLREDIDALKQELNEVRSVVENRKAIFFDVQAKKPGKYVIELIYILYGASWWTYYDLRANPNDKKVEISYFGKVSQNTGEDWDDTKIVLSTGQPAVGGAAPEPQPWYISLYRPPEDEARDAYRAKKEMPAASKSVAAEGTVAPQVPEMAPPVETGLAIWYPLPGKYTIKSGDQERKILIYKTTLDGEFEYFIMPRVIQQAYSMAKVKNTTEYLYIAGEAGTYVGDDFTGKVYFPTIAPDEKVDISFGVDDRVKVKRESKKMKVTKGGLLGSKTKYEFIYENSIENFHTSEIKCKIVDQVPIAGDPEIKVSDVKFNPRPTEEDKDRSIYTWQIPISGKTKYVITASFTVEGPADGNIQGLM